MQSDTQLDDQLALAVEALLNSAEITTYSPILSAFQLAHFASGDVLMRQGDEADAMYLIISGRVQFELNDGRIVGQATRGETVGEFALLAPSTRSATVRAVRDTSVAIMTRDDFEHLSLTYPILLRAVTRIVVQRRQRDLGLLPPQLPVGAISLTLMPTQPKTDARPFAHQLLAALCHYGDATILDAAAFEAASGLSAQTTLEDEDNLAVVRWLNNLERQCQHLLFIPDASWTAWTRRCVSQSDRVLLLADREKSAEIAPLEQQLETNHPHMRRDLVMWHPANTEEPTETRRWLERRDVGTHFHVRDGDAVHFGRMARRLTNRAIGLVLAGGGARGYVHVGVFQALEEIGVPVDYIGGASFGALLGVNKAREYTFQQTIAASDKLANKRSIFDSTLPFAALNRSENVTNLCRAHFGDLQLEDLWVPFFAIAANLTQQRMEVIERGDAWIAIRKSIAIPGIFTPVIDNGDQIVDGGVMNNFPVDVLCERAESKRIIGIRCAPSGGKRYTYDMETSVSGWRVLLNQLNPFAKKLRTPRIADTVFRSVLVNSSRLAEQNEKLCDLFISLQPRGYGLLSFERYQEITAFGYENSLEPIREWAGKQEREISFAALST